MRFAWLPGEVGWSSGEVAWSSGKVARSSGEGASNTYIIADIIILTRQTTLGQASIVQ